MDQFSVLLTLGNVILGHRRPHYQAGKSQPWEGSAGRRRDELQREKREGQTRERKRETKRVREGNATNDEARG